MFIEHILKDEFIDHYEGRIIIKDKIFQLDFRNGNSISGDVNEDISSKYMNVNSEICYVTLGKSLIYNEEVNDTYEWYRLIDMLV